MKNLKLRQTKNMGTGGPFSTYKIVRFYYPGHHLDKRTIKTGLSLAQAQEHCQNPKTRKEGKYFDGYTEEKS